jgi:hypothetical protein
MAIKFSVARRLYTLQTGDTPPTIASHAGLPTPAPGDMYWNSTTNLLYMTYDGTNWVLFLTCG